MTDIGDVILVYFEEQPAFFGRIEDIVADVKPGWYRMKFLLLQVPLNVGEWILRTEYIQGKEFTMGGKKVRIERVVAPPAQEPDDTPPEPGKVIPLRKKPGNKP
jgi:hypothetical protein